jgi:hypothetical protein
MPDNLSRFGIMITGLGTIAGIMIVILTSTNLSEAQKYFAIDTFLILLLVLYIEAFYQRRGEAKPVKQTAQEKMEKGMPRRSSQSEAASLGYLIAGVAILILLFLFLRAIGLIH